MKRILFFTGLLIFWVSQEAGAQFRSNRGQTQTAANEPTLSYAAPQEYIIAGIEVTGLNVLDKNAMISLTGLKIGDKIKIPGDGISGAIRKLWKHGLVGDVTISVQKIEGTNVYLSVILTERPRLNDFYFVGINKSKQSALKEDLKLIKGKIVNDATIRNAELSVKKHFVKKGFLNTVVKVVPEADTLNRGGVRLRIDVNLMAKVKINAVYIEGNDAIADARLKGKLKKTHEHARITIHRAILSELLMFKPSKIKPALDSSRKLTTLDIKEFINRNVKLNIFAGSKFIRSEFEEDKAKLIQYYNTQGYRDAQILSDTIINFDKANIDVKLQVYEGRKYYFRNINWVGNYIHSTNTLNKILDINKGDVYNQEMIDKKTTFNPKGADISGFIWMMATCFSRLFPWKWLWLATPLMLRCECGKEIRQLSMK
jgi:outer membrane protein insertion porin family